MNAIGHLGEFIIDYQGPILIAAIVILAAGIICAIIKAIRFARHKRELLAEIKDTVSEINTTVTSLKEKQPVAAESADVIYIDNRICPGETPGEVFHKAPASEAKAPMAQESEPQMQEQTPQETADNPFAPSTEQENQIPCEEAEAKASEELDEESDTTEEPAPRRYFSRDCAVSKNGKIYTVEELNSQIKE